MKRLAVTLVCVLGLSCSAEPPWIALFDGHSLSGWTVSEHPDAVRVENGEIVCTGPRAHVYYTGDVHDGRFKNFELKVDVLTGHGANSGLYVHTAYREEGWPDKGYEVQIYNNTGGVNPSRELVKTGSLYGVRNVFKSVAQDEAWFTLHVVVRGRRVQARVDDVLVVDYVEPDDPPRTEGAQGRLLSDGTFALQCHGPDGEVRFKNVRVTPLPDDADDGVTAPPVVDDVYTRIYELNAAGFPLIDSHVHLRETLTLDAALEKSRRDGIFYALAPNAGIGFPITDDAGIYAYLDAMQGVPVFQGMQAEGREWVETFSREAAARFDFVFTDALTFFDDDGRRLQLWRSETVGEIADPEAFMDLYVDRIMGVLSAEPIDVFVNPTVLPEILRADYDALWTDARMQAVIDAAVAHDVAIEINDRYRAPSERFIRLAKEAGVLFTCGTNNNAADNLGRLAYCLEMIDACGLTRDDMFMPKPDGQKAIQRKAG